MPEQQPLHFRTDQRAGETLSLESARVARAEEMLLAFASVGVEAFHLTLTDTAGKVRVYREEQTLSVLTEKLPVIVHTRP